MKVLLVGGGSGGHVTPLKAIIQQITKKDPSVQCMVVTDRQFFQETQQIFTDHQSVRLQKIFAGKLRRYHNKSLFWHLTHLPTVLQNIRDIWYLFIGFIQSLFLLLTFRPNTIFCKGGFVCVPVGYAARLLKIPLVIHDSDTRPGLTNRLLASHAKTIATGMPTSFYPYEKSRMVYTGMPVSERFTVISSTDQAQYKKELGFGSNQPILLVTGGGKGAVSLNSYVAEAAPTLLKQGWGIIQVTGRGKAKAVQSICDTLPSKQRKNWHIEEFTDMVPRILAADVVVMRTSASTLQECANAKKLVIGVPSPYLEDQKMNAEFFRSRGAILFCSEEELTEDNTLLRSHIQSLHDIPEDAAAYSERLHKIFAKPHAAQQLAEIVLGSAGR